MFFIKKSRERERKGDFKLQHTFRFIHFGLAGLPLYNIYVTTINYKRINTTKTTKTIQLIKMAIMKWKKMLKIFCRFFLPILLLFPFFLLQTCNDVQFSAKTRTINGKDVSDVFVKQNIGILLLLFCCCSFALLICYT